MTVPEYSFKPFLTASAIVRASAKDFAQQLNLTEEHTQVGLLIGLGAAFLVDYLDNSLRDEEDLAKSTRLPVLAVIPKLKDWKPTDVHIVTREQPSSPPAEAYRPDFVWSQLAERFARALDGTTIEDLCRDATQADVPRVEAEAPMYFI